MSDDGRRTFPRETAPPDPADRPLGMPERSEPTQRPLITVEDLHDAADVVGAAESGEELGFAVYALEQFIDATDWSALGSPRKLPLDTLSLAVGISIGAIAERNRG